MKKLLSIIFVSLLLSGSAHATLKGINEVDLLVEQLSPDGEKCSLTRRSIETTAKYILQNSKIKITDSAYTPLLYIEVIVLNNGGSCSVFSRITVETFAAKDPFKLGNSGAFVFYQNSRIVSGGTDSNIGNFVISKIEEMMKELVVKHHEDNQ
tara:strand:+ start:39 stop:497 length:459 start_codon:yes stop_codon:yes gene_type:complete